MALPRRMEKSYGGIASPNKALISTSSYSATGLASGLVSRMARRVSTLARRFYNSVWKVSKLIFKVGLSRNLKSKKSKHF